MNVHDVVRMLGKDFRPRNPSYHLEADDYGEGIVMVHNLSGIGVPFARKSVVDAYIAEFLRVNGR